MRSSDILTILCSVLCCVKLCASKRGFILTSPKVIDAGSTEYFTLTVLDVPNGGEVALRLLSRWSDTVLAESKVTVINNYNMWVEMNIPVLPDDTTARLQVRSSFSDGYVIDAVKEVSVRHNSIVTFIQTDKPLYKPGQKVRFRVLPMDTQLKPIEKEAVGDIWIEDPSGIRIAQWKKMSFADGIAQFELPLSDEPTFGIWNIKSNINEVKHVQSFSVEEYVLPKFEVVVKPPDYVMADAQTITTEICARYTYGKKVDGTLKARITLKRKFFWDTNEDSVPSVDYHGPISGCHSFVVNAVDLQLDKQVSVSRDIEVFAEVTENGTDIVRNASAIVKQMHKPVFLKFLLPQTDYFKPGLPYYGKLKAASPDGKPATSEKIQICTHGQYSREQSCSHYTTDKNGLVSFSIPPQDTLVTKLNIFAEATEYKEVLYNDHRWRPRIEKPTVSMDLVPYYSPSNSYLQIEPITEEVQCEKLERVKIRYTVEKGSTIKFYHQVISRGRIVQQGSHHRTYYENDASKQQYVLGPTSNTSRLPDVGEFILSFDPRATMSPIARLLVFYVREDGEVVADARMFRIAHCLLNKVSLHFRHEQQYPSTEASLLLSASPLSFCGIGLVDKSMEILHRDQQFDKEQIFKLMERYDVGKRNFPRQVREEYCSEKESKVQRVFPSPDDHFWRSVSVHADATMAFEEAGMVVMTDLTLETRPCFKKEPIAIALETYSLPRVMGASGNVHARSGVRPKAAPKRVTENDVVPYEEEKPDHSPSATEIRSYFPETWLWEMHRIGASGEMALKRSLPHTITEWVGKAVCVHPKTGLGISDKSSITAFQPFFVSFTLPYSVVRGEVVPVIVSVFNYLSECLPIKLSLETSEDYKVISDSREHKVCVCGGESASHRFLARPEKLGNVNFTVYGHAFEDDLVCENEVTARLSARDAVTRTLLVEAEGFPKEEVFNYFFCPQETNGSYAIEVDLLLPEDIVEESARAYMSVTGDLMGPALSGLKNLVKLPVGCGEQNMVLFTPNIYVLDYMTATGKITEHIKAECLNNMKTGYQRELKYRHSDGSYSAFGDSDPVGSLWLTAFVVKSFSQSRRFITVDENDLALSTSWITKKQFENGCFEPTGHIIHTAMKGGLSEGEHSLAPLTAYVLISLLESGYREESTIQGALRCLEAESSPSTYALSLFAYAATLAKHPTATKYLQDLEERAIKKDSLMHWDYGNSHSKSVSVEISGYYILTLMEMKEQDNVAKALMVVKWVTRQRNSNGGFVSTQDTVIALQALAKYASVQSQGALDIGMVIESDELVQGFKIDDANKLLTQTVKIPVLPTVVDLQAVGDGCTVVQFSLRYNVEKISGSEAFDLNVDTVRLGSSNCNLPRIGICMRYKPFGQTSNMVVISVKMASGFEPESWSLQELHSEENLQLKRHEIDGNNVNFYFNELSNEQKCFKFFVKNEMEVEDVQPASVKLYDYYQPDLEVTKEYEIPSGCTVAMLPELPRLPPLVAGNDDDSDSQSATSPPENDNETAVAVTDDDMEPEPTNNDEPGNATEPEPLSSFGNGSSEAMALSDDAAVLQTLSNLENFVNLEEELDFPDGIEGNKPVTVDPPSHFIPIMTTEVDREHPSCPVCVDKFPANFTDIFCSSAFVLRIVIRDTTSKSVKILQDISYYNAQPKALKIFGKLIYDERCSCSNLDTRSNYLLVIGTSINQWDSSKEKHQLHLENDVYVIPTSSKVVQPLQVKSARNSCAEDL